MNGDFINITIQEVLDRLGCFPDTPYNYFVVEDHKYFTSSPIGDNFLNNLCSDIDDCFSLMCKVCGDKDSNFFDKYVNFNEKLRKDKKFKLEVIDYICESFALKAENEYLRYLIPIQTDSGCSEFTILWRNDDVWSEMTLSLKSVIKCVHYNF